MYRIQPIILLLLALAAPLAADDAAPFLLEKIEVRNATRVSPDIVIAESLLRARQSYRESDLRAANDRLRRLPYLVDAQFSLEKGSARGSYVLVISIVETKPFFYLVDLTSYHESERQYVADADNQAVAGYRLFVGRRGVLHGGVSTYRDDRPYTSRYSALDLGYTHYDIFGTRAFATVSLRAETSVGDTKVRPAFVAGIPLSGTQTITVDYDDLEMGDRVRRSERVATARWTYNTTNHPFFPTHGMIATVAPVVTWTDVTDELSRNGQTLAAHRRTYGGEVSVARYWELSELWSTSVRLDGGWATLETTGDAPVESGGEITYGGGTVRLSRSIRKDADSEQRLELKLNVDAHESRALLRDDYFYAPAGSAYAHTTTAVSWVRRDSWGSLRLGLGYAW